jgi:hypothetical protein
MKKIQLYGVISAALAVLITVSVFIKMPYSYSLQGKIMSGHEWMLIRQNDGSLAGITRNNIKGIIQNYSAYQIDRGDMIWFSVNPGMRTGIQLSTKDTLGIFTSSFLLEELAELQGQLDVAYATLEVNRTGEKSSMLEEAENTYMLNLEKAKVQKQILERQTSLFADNLVSTQDYDITKGQTRVAELEVQAAEARLQSLKTGAKIQEINLNRVEIQAIERNLETLKNRINHLYLVSPVCGDLHLEIANDTLMIVSDTMRVVILPVPIEYFNEISVGQRVSVREPYNGDTLFGKVIRVEKIFRIVARQQVFLVTTLLENAGSGLPVNLIVSASIEAEPRSVWRYLSDMEKILLF